uniref:Uncharacterized protein n=1 Tax=Solanum tuberosum TaxID=4113 RepID=M1C3R8_SOLTU
MVDEVPDAIGCVFGNLTPLELRILDRIDFGQQFEFRASNGNFVSSIVFENVVFELVEWLIMGGDRSMILDCELYCVARVET